MNDMKNYPNGKVRYNENSGKLKKFSIERIFNDIIVAEGEIWRSKYYYADQEEKSENHRTVVLI